MFIYCGDNSDGTVRVLDTQDGVVDSIDRIQLKVVQAQGYTIKKDFSFDFADNIVGLLSSYSIKYGVSALYLAYGSVVGDPDYLHILNLLYYFNSKTGLAITEDIVKRSVLQLAVYYGNKKFGVFSYITKEGAKLYKLYVIHISAKGIITSNRFFNTVFVLDSYFTFDTWNLTGLEYRAYRGDTYIKFSLGEDGRIKHLEV